MAKSRKGLLRSTREENSQDRVQGAHGVRVPGPLAKAIAFPPAIYEVVRGDRHHHSLAGSNFVSAPRSFWAQTVKNDYEAEDRGRARRNRPKRRGSTQDGLPILAPGLGRRPPPARGGSATGKPPRHERAARNLR